MSKHEWHDITITGYEYPSKWEKNILTLKIDPSKDEDSEVLEYMFFSKQDIVRMAKMFDLVVFDKKSQL